MLHILFDKHPNSEILQKHLKILENWETFWDMSFNPSKCQVIHVTRRNKLLQTKHYLHDCVLVSVPSAKYLDLTISEDLKWFEHINKVRKTANISNQNNQVPHLTQDTTWESDKITIRHHKQKPRGQTFPSRRPQGSNAWQTPGIKYTNDPQKKYHLGTVNKKILEGSNRFHNTSLTLSSDVDQDT